MSPLNVDSVQAKATAAHSKANAPQNQHSNPGQAFPRGAGPQGTHRTTATEVKPQHPAHNQWQGPPGGGRRPVDPIPRGCFLCGQAHNFDKCERFDRNNKQQWVRFLIPLSAAELLIFLLKQHCLHFRQNFTCAGLSNRNSVTHRSAAWPGNFVLPCLIISTFPVPPVPPPHSREHEHHDHSPRVAELHTDQAGFSSRCTTC